MILEEEILVSRNGSAIREAVCSGPLFAFHYNDLYSWSSVFSSDGVSWLDKSWFDYYALPSGREKKWKRLSNFRIESETLECFARIVTNGQNAETRQPLGTRFPLATVLDLVGRCKRGHMLNLT